MPADLPLLERAAELAAIEVAIADARHGHGRFVLVNGPAGIGKTKLLAHVRRASRRSPVFAARGSDLETPFAFGVVRQLLEPVVAAATGEERGRLFSGAAEQAARVFEQADVEGTAELATLHGLFWLTVNLCARPATMLVDDLHWADVASLRFLAYLQARLDGVPLLVAASVRSGEPAADDGLIGRMLADPDAVVLRPAALSQPAAADVLAAALGRPADAAFARACFVATGGNPLLLQALARTVGQDGLQPTGANAARVLDLGPRAVEHLVSLRLATVGPSVRAVARAIAVLGPDAAISAVRDLAGLDAVTTSEAVAELVRRDMVDVDPSGGEVACFVHPLVAAATYAGMGVRERAQAHRRAAEALDRTGVPAERVGAHLLKVPPGADPAVVARLRRAAAVAMQRGSAESALTFLRRCLEERMDPSERYAALTEAAALAIDVDLPAAVPILEEARRRATEPADIAWLSLRLGAAYGYLLDPDSAYAAVAAARDRLPPGDEDLRRRLEATLLIAPLVAPGRLHVADRVPELAELPPHDSVGGRMLDAVLASHEMARADPRGRDRARAALADGTLLRVANGEGPLVSAWLTLLAADDPIALESLDAAVALAHHNGSLRALAAAYCFRAMGRLWAGQLADAERDAREALHLTRTGRVDMDPSFAGGYLAGALLDQGRVDEAEFALRSLDILGGDPEAQPHYYALDAWARLRCRQGRFAEALPAAYDAGRSWRAFGFTNPALGDWRSTAALSAFRLGKAEEASAHAREELAIAREWGIPRAIGRSLRVLGEVTGGAEGMALLRESVQVLENGPARLERAASLLELGAAVRRGGARSEAKELLSRAVDEAEICGAEPLAARAAAELRVAGFRPRRHRLTGVEALTPSERRVAEAAAAGATNREIAQALFVTMKTVEVHLSSAYRKLGVSRRQELVRHVGPG